ncbi:DUF1272 domain-containing protein [Microbulbifer sp. OS29]|uniref:DUF1272 domain-containing protein n=1 Tax=Microbulbifer okhotskensis TaxID=2926617 RepID=A0A9X2ET62_9GAMM|nr:DUF1272 domain-containing protein [Microbulbifer okhotskensis]MCO1335303.1 DUF1272 domain-containing protein [Microbulbifer okhotskensis]
MLQIRPNCESCDRDLPPDSPEARICTYECTFCQSCVETLLSNVCPNCGGNFCPRPLRPRVARRNGVGIEFQPASKQRMHTAFSPDEIREFANGTKDINPADR